MPHPTPRPRINRVDLGLPLAIALLGTGEILGVQAPGSAGGIAIEWVACALLGLIGLAERVSAHGGTLAYGQAGAVFRLGLSLPVPTELVAA